MEQSKPERVTETLAVSIGSVAKESLVDGQRGSVFGVTSRGIFIKTESRFLNFLSFDQYRGPLTINLSPDDGSIPDIEAGTEVEIFSQSLNFPDAGWRISLREAEIWRPQKESGPILTRADRQERLTSLANRIMETNSTAGLASLLPRLLETSDQHEEAKKSQPRLHEQILQLLQEMKSTDGLPPIKAVKGLLGSGAGLTPSGDDFVIGLLLVINRWINLFQDQPGLDLFNSQIVSAAYQKTTTLSANLIECAVLGLANERLINTLDWLVGGSDPEPIPAEGLLSWGHSSGIDVFAGFAAALSIR